MFGLFLGGICWASLLRVVYPDFTADQHTPQAAIIHWSNISSLLVLAIMLLLSHSLIFIGMMIRPKSDCNLKYDQSKDQTKISI
jgi:hypothetical protein